MSTSKPPAKPPSHKLQALWQQGQRYTQQKSWRQAAAAYEAILDYDRDFLPAWLELSTAYEQQDAYRAAFDAVRNAARIRGVPPMAGLAVARRLRRFEALSDLQRYIDDTGLASHVAPEKLIDLSSFFASAGDYAHTLGWVDAALKQRPQLPEAHHMRGLILMFAGRNAEAAESFERALSLRPHFAVVYSVLSKIARVDAGHHHIDILRRLLQTPGLDPKDEGHYAYALHNELHDLGDHDGAWDALSRACRARKTLQPYDHAQTRAMFDRLRAIFDAGFCDSAAGAEVREGDSTPIFIVGLHRSGTTLLERILSGHPDVADAGETYHFSAQLRYAGDHFCNTIIDTPLVEAMPGMDYAEVGRGFLDAMRVFGRSRRFVTEKMNPNFILLGPIARALPQARLLHMRRDAADTCFSNLRTLFTREAAYSYDQVEMADYCKLYVDLMAHWRQAMPARVLDIDYDALVSEPETQAQRIAAHCGFDYREDMLRIERDSGMVATASAHQVRQGIVRNRGGIWRAYERHLGPMLERLAAHGLA